MKSSKKSWITAQPQTEPRIYSSFLFFDRAAKVWINGKIKKLKKNRASLWSETLTVKCKNELF